jgi:PPIC-type PPIASE domain/SurA N-terminal domain
VKGGAAGRMDHVVVSRCLLCSVMVAAAIFGSACGASAPSGGDDLPDGVVAKVGERTLTGAELERFLAEVRASYKAHHRSFPEPGSAEDANLTARAVEDLVGRLQDELTADELGVVVTDDEVEAVLERYRRAAGAEEFDRTIAGAGITLERVRADMRARLLESAIFTAAVSGVKPTDDDLRAYYDAHRDDYTRWSPRLVDRLFVRDKALAHELYDRIRVGEDFLALAKEYGDREVPSGRIMIADIGLGRLPFQHDAFTLAAGEVSLTRSGVGWTIVRPVSPLEPGRLIPFEDVADALRIELTEKEHKQVMDAWTKENETKLAAVTSYRAGWDPTVLRRKAPFPAPTEPQRPWSQCGLPEGEYTYEQLSKLGCAGDFLIPGVDGPACPEPLIEDPYVGGLEESEIESGYADYLMSDAGSCVPDPRETIEIVRRSG